MEVGKLDFNIEYQENFSRGKLLLRTFFGVIYIAIPHLFLLIFISFAISVVSPLAALAILFTGKHPQGLFNFSLGYWRWQARLAANLTNLTDTHPKIGLAADSESVKFQVDYPESFNRVSVIFRSILGPIVVGIPQGIVLSIRTVWSGILQSLAFWIVLFTGRYPEGWHSFAVGTLRWQFRIAAWYAFLITDRLPPFNGRHED